MNFETLVGLLIIVFYVLPAILKRVAGKKRAAGPGADKPAAGGVVARFSEKMRQLIKELERQAAEAQKKSTSRTDQDGSQWDQFMDEEETTERIEPLDDFQWADEPGPSPNAGLDSTKETVQAAAAEKRATPVKPLKSGPPAAARQTVPEERPLPATAFSEATTQDLQRAVVWSEILSPPLALRDDR